MRCASCKKWRPASLTPSERALFKTEKTSTQVEKEQEDLKCAKKELVRYWRQHQETAASMRERKKQDIEGLDRVRVKLPWGMAYLRRSNGSMITSQMGRDQGREWDK